MRVRVGERWSDGRKEAGAGQIERAAAAEFPASTSPSTRHFYLNAGCEQSNANKAKVNVILGFYLGLYIRSSFN